jgi:rhombotail lipoprotein
MKRVFTWVCIGLIGLAGLAGCGSMDQSTRQRQVASLLTYLYPGKDEAPVPSNEQAVLKVPFRMGVAFVPDNNDPRFRLAESDRQKLATQVRDAFAPYPFIGDITVVPSMYLEPGGGWKNLDQIAALLKLDVIALLSFDQVQHAGANGWSFLYWTGVGAYMVDGDQYDILTAVETAVLDIRSRRMLMRAGGISNIKGSATMVGLSEEARQARTKGFNDAIGQMIDNLHGEVKAFRERAPKDPGIKMILPAGYDPNATRR